MAHVAAAIRECQGSRATASEDSEEVYGEGEIDFNGEISKYMVNQQGAGHTS